MPPTQQRLEIGRGPRQGSSVGFTTQGQVDWAAFSTTLFSATMSIWQRLSGNNVQPTTFGGSLVIGSRFRLGHLGERHIDHAISQLHVVNGYGNSLHFGFGVQAMVRTLAETQEGVNFIGLSSCLSDVHSEPMVARIFTELWQLEDFPAMFQPSHSQFLQLVKTCSGVILGSGFSQVVDTIVGDLGRFRDEPRFKTMLSGSDAVDIAKALKGLFNMTTGKVDRIKFVGGMECLFLAALALWLFDFRVYVVDENGRPTFTNVEVEEDAQVSVTLMNHFDDRKIVIESTTYMLPPSQDDQHELFVETGEISLLRLIIRTPWDGCIRRVFATTPKSKRIFTMTRHLGIYLGSVARIYSALALSETDIDKFSRNRYIDFSLTSYGMGFVDTILETFPELQRLTNLEDVIRESVTAPFKVALDSIESAINCIRSLCACQLCSGTEIPNIAETGSQKDECLVTLALTIRHVASLKSIVIQDGSVSIDPTIQGLEAIYETNWQVWKNCLKGRDLVASVCALPLKVDDDRTSNVGLDTSLLIANIRHLYTGIRPPTDEDDHYKVTAMSAQGICFYFDALRSPTCDPSLTRRIHIIAGHIARDARRYEYVFDGANSRGIAKDMPEAELSVPGAQTEVEVNKAIMSMKERTNSWTLKSRLEVLPVVTERWEDREINFYYKVIIEEGHEKSYFHIQPGLLTESVLLASGKVSCPSTIRGSMCPISERGFPIPVGIIGKGWRISEGLIKQLTFRAGLACLLWTTPSTTETARCLVVSLARQNNAELILKGSACINCCLKEAALIQLQPGIRSRLIFVI